MKAEYNGSWDEERAWCPICGAEHDILRPGKTQPTCECHLACPFHGPNSFDYHGPGECGDRRIQGWYCMACESDDKS